MTQAMDAYHKSRSELHNAEAEIDGRWQLRRSKMDQVASLGIRRNNAKHVLDAATMMQRCPQPQPQSSSPFPHTPYVCVSPSASAIYGQPSSAGFESKHSNTCALSVEPWDTYPRVNHGIPNAMSGVQCYPGVTGQPEHQGAQLTSNSSVVTGQPVHQRAEQQPYCLSQFQGHTPQQPNGDNTGHPLLFPNNPTPAMR